MKPSADCTLSLGGFLEMMAERLAADGVADPPPPVEMIAARLLGLTRERLDSEAGRPPTPEGWLYEPRQRARWRGASCRIGPGRVDGSGAPSC